MTTVEQLILKLGVNTSAVATGLRSVKGQMASFASSVSGSLGSILGGAALYAQFNKIGDMAERIRNNAEAWNVSTKFVQDIENVARATGLSAEKMQSLMDKFIKGLPVGADVEQSFYKIADSLAAIPDPATRARAAQEAFGKSGMDMIRIAGGGSAALKELASGYTTLSEAELKAADQAKQNIEDAEGRLTIFAGQTIGLLTKVSEFWGKVWAMGERGGSNKNAWKELGDMFWADKNVGADTEGVQKRREAAKFAAQKKWEKYQKDLAEWKEKQSEKQAKIDATAAANRIKAAEQLRKAEEKVAEARARSANASKELSDFKRGRTDWTLSELASLDPSAVVRQGRWKIGAAQNVEWMRQEAKLARLAGNDRYAEQMISRSDTLAKSIGGLSSSDQDPTKELRERAAETAEACKSLANAVSGNAININPVNGP